MNDNSKEDEWVRISGYREYYVNREGLVLSTKQNKRKTLRLCKRRNGYVCVGLCQDRIIRTASVHRLVAEAFIPNPEHKKEVNHINGIPHDNRVENLEWSTRSENELHSWRVLGKRANPDKLRHRSKPVLDLETGIYYSSLTEGCIHIGRNKDSESTRIKFNYRTKRFTFL